MNDNHHPRPDQLPPIRTPRDLHARWRTLMGELGFSDRTLWVTFLEPDGAMVPHIVQVAELPTYPTAPNLDSLIEVCGRELDILGAGAAVAMLLSRPGHDVLTDADRAWGAGIAATARAHDVRAHPLHLANDEAVRVLAPDDLIGAA
ncbi:hypothetical protein [Solicola gregarius]|uniref:Uncharacterized protein n=1 Tax=Solicola gregarius TaxID=2908642 RepID=A0AA46YJ36_9ACTN|nr:hypothetical protein [Solicola gregarius]UYM03807.1 hypothetical protein L0C25_14795 [Solicola gregarius]